MGRGGKKKKNNQQQQQEQNQKEEPSARVVTDQTKEDSQPSSQNNVLDTSQEQIESGTPNEQSNHVEPPAHLLMDLIDKKMARKNQEKQTIQENQEEQKAEDASQDGGQAQGQAQQSKNARKKAQKKKSNQRQVWINAIKERNLSEIKCPKDLEEEGVVEGLHDIRLNDQNKYGARCRRDRANERAAQRERSESGSGNSGSDGDVEEIDDYHPDGYHAAHVGEIIDSKYMLLKKLGWGHFSTVWLAFKLSDKQLYALKIQKSAQKYTESGFEEEEILHEVATNYQDPKWVAFLQKFYDDPNLEATRDHTHNLQMFDSFFHHALNGKHYVMAFEVLGKNLLSLLSKYDHRGVPLPTVKRIAKGLLLGLDYMHRVCGIIHTDLKPENVVFQLTERKKFELLRDNVLRGPLIALFETETPIILNSKQLKNQKKKDRKKRKRNLNVNGNDEEEKEEGEDDKEQEPKSQLPRTQAVAAAFSLKIKEAEQKYAMVPEMEKSRSRSAVQQRGRFFALTVEDEANQEVTEEQKADGSPPVKLHLQDPTDILMHPLKKNKHRKYLRVSSQERLESVKEKAEELRPLTDYDVNRMQELDLQVKLCDMGNACYIDQHYSDIIQTREYRSPEVILGGDYDTTADIWSLACMIFELVTGDYLFDPKKGQTFRKNDDHLALITELLGPCYDRNFMERQTKVWKFYEKGRKTSMKLRNITKLHSWSLYTVLLEKYRLKDQEARSLSSFLEAMLRWKPKDRASARDLLAHPWLKESDEYGVWMSKGHLKEFKMVNHKQFPGYLDELRAEKAKRELEEQQRKEREARGEASPSSEEAASDGSSELNRRDKENLEEHKEDQPAGSSDEEDEKASSGSESSPYESGRTSREESGSDDEEDEAKEGDEDDEWEDEDDQ